MSRSIFIGSTAFPVCLHYTIGTGQLSVMFLFPLRFFQLFGTMKDGKKGSERMRNPF